MDHKITGMTWGIISERYKITGFTNNDEVVKDISKHPNILAGMGSRKVGFEHFNWMRQTKEAPE